MQMSIRYWTLAENKHVGVSRMLCFHFWVPVKCWTLAEDKHVGANWILGFHSGCQSDAGL